VPLSGAAQYRGGNHDVDVYWLGRDWPPLACECKARKNGSGFAVLEKWLGAHDALLLRRNHADPLILLPWRTWAALLNKNSCGVVMSQRDSGYARKEVGGPGGVARSQDKLIGDLLRPLARPSRRHVNNTSTRDRKSAVLRCSQAAGTAQKPPK
jgi:hypothetical protein